MARTRSKPAPKAAAEPDSTTLPPPSKTLESDSNPPKLFVLPKDASPDARIITLNNPATATPSRYLFCPDKGFYEFTRVAAPKKTPRSWLITSNSAGGDEKPQSTETENEGVKKTEEKDTPTPKTNPTIPKAYITKSADIFLATPIDILFLLLPALASKSTKSKQPQNFLSLDDHLDAFVSTSPHLKSLIRDPRLKTMITNRLPTICDFVDAGCEKMYRLSHEKLAKLLLAKAQRMVKNGLPASMEEKFIKPALIIPVMSVKREESSLSLATETTGVAVTEDVNESQESITETAVDSQTTATTTEPSPKTLTTPPEIPPLLRLRTALTYLQNTYIPPTLHTPLTTTLSTLISFTPLDQHLAAISKLRSEATALQSLSNNISRKRAYEDDEEKIAEREEKKRKKEEEEKKKKLETRGVKQLKKVNTAGMMKLSSFFGKAAAKK